MDINIGEFIVLVVLAVLIFGPDKLPELARKTARVIHMLRNVANDAQYKVREQLGNEVVDQIMDLRSLDPKTIVRDKVLGAATYDSLQADLAAAKTDFTEATAGVSATVAETSADYKEAISAAADSQPVVDDVAQAAMAPAAPVFDDDAT